MIVEPVGAPVGAVPHRSCNAPPSTLGQLRHPIRLERKPALPASHIFSNSLWFGRGVLRMMSAFIGLAGPSPSRPAVFHTNGAKVDPCGLASEVIRDFGGSSR